MMTVASKIPSPTIDLKTITHRFGNETVLSEINLSVAAGEFVSLIGPSGCGKSTLLRLVAGLESLQTGSLAFQSAETSPALSTQEPKRAFVFQDASLLPWRTVFDNVALPLELAGTSKRDRSEKTRRQLSLVGLVDEDQRKLPRMLSGGMKMRVSLARALVTEPQVLLMDEPFAALDDILRTQLNQELLALWSQQQWTTLFVTHQIAEAVFLSDRVVVMSHHPGKIHDILDIDLPRPRDPNLRGTHAFANVVSRLQKSLSEVV
jgi:NitT/TauT family transport system ATP-binding protein